MIEYLPDCINSIRNQLFTDYEIILIDDGSTDGSGAFCDLCVCGNTRVVHQKNKGISSARNAGLAIAVGEYISFIDPDDCIEPDFYQLLIGALEANDNMDVAVCLFRIMGKEPSSDNAAIVHINNERAMLELIIQQNFNHSVCTKVFRRKTIESMRFADGYTSEDTLFCFQAFSQARSVVFCAQHKYIYRIRPNSITTSTFSDKNFDLIYMMQSISASLQKQYPSLYPFFRLRLLDVYLCYLRKLETTAFRYKYPHKYYEILSLAKEQVSILRLSVIKPCEKIKTLIAILCPHFWFARMNKERIKFFSKNDARWKSILDNCELSCVNNIIAHISINFICLQQ